METQRRQLAPMEAESGAGFRAEARGYLLVVSAALLWASLGILGKLLYRFGIDPLTVVALRAVIAFVTLAAVLAVVNRRLLRIQPRDLPFFAVYGLVGVAMNYAFYFFALSATSVATAVILLYTYPALVTLLAAVFLGERLNWVKGLTLVMTLGGCYLVAQGYDPTALRVNTPGVLFGLGAGASAAVYSLLGKKSLQTYDSWTAVCYAFGFGALFLVLWRSPQALLAADYPWTAWVILLVLGWFPTLLAYALYTTAMKYIQASRASLTATLEPAAASLLAFLFLGEVLEWPQLVGIGLVLAGILLLSFSREASPVSGSS